MADRRKGSPAAKGRDGRNDGGRFAVANRFWELRKRAGDKPKFETAEQLWEACAGYFEWVEANPLQEDRLVTYMGHATHEPVDKMRAMTIEGLCLHIGVTNTTWREWRLHRADLAEVVEVVEMIIRTQKFEGAAADLLNVSIIARDLGLADRQELTGRDGGPIQTEEVTRDADAFTSRLSGLAAARAERGGADEADAGGEGST